MKHISQFKELLKKTKKEEEQARCRNCILHPSVLGEELHLIACSYFEKRKLQTSRYTGCALRAIGLDYYFDFTKNESIFANTANYASLTSIDCHKCLEYTNKFRNKNFREVKI